MTQPNQMLTAKEVSDFFLHRTALDTQRQEPMTNLRLQKLLYYSQAWNLALTGEPMFAEDVEAWTNGPVVPSVYTRFKGHGNRRLPTECVASPVLTATQRSLLNAVWYTYGDLPTSRLWRMTHEEEPWKRARHGLSDGDHGTTSVSRESMRDYYGARLKRDEERRLVQQRAAYAKQPTTALERACADEAVKLIAAS